MRKLFSRQLVEARHEMLSIFEAVDLTLHDAVRAYVTDDRDLAKKAKEKTFQIDARCANLEAVCYNLIATQSPVASDSPASDHHLHRFQPPAHVRQGPSHRTRRESQGQERFRGARRPRRPHRDRGRERLSRHGRERHRARQQRPFLVLSLSDEDEVVHDLYQKFFRTFNRTEAVELDDDAAMDDFRRTIMVSRYLDRIANISMDALSPGLSARPASAGPPPISRRRGRGRAEGMRVPSGEGVILDPATDAHYVSSLPLDEVGSELKRLIEEGREEA